MSQGFGLKERAIPNTNPNKSVRAFRMFQLQSTPEGELEDAPVEQEPSMSSSDKDIAAEVFARFSTDGEVLQEADEFTFFFKCFRSSPWWQWQRVRRAVIFRLVRLII